jgi:hypothetical protein
MRGPRPRSFEEVVIAQDPTEKARLARGEHFNDPSVSPFHGDRCRLTKIATVRVSGVLSILNDGGCYVTIFAGPASERRARDYFASLKSGRLKIQREPLPQ